MGRLLRCVWPLIISAFYTLPTLCNAAAGESYTVAVVPQLAATQTYRDWTPFLSQLANKTGIQFNLKIYSDNAVFEKDLSRGGPDLVFLNPYQMLTANQKRGYLPLIRDRSNLVGIIVCRADSQINSVQELDGQKIAFPSPYAFSASIYLRALLTEKQHIKFTPEFVNGHQNVYRHVLLGEAAAGGGVTKTLERESDSLRAQLKIIFTAPEIASHPLAAHPRVTGTARRKIIQAILSMPADTQSAEMLKAVQLTEPVRAEYKRDYSGLAKLKVERYATPQKNRAH